jgi:hypothetical protein
MNDRGGRQIKMSVRAECRVGNVRENLLDRKHRVALVQYSAYVVEYRHGRIGESAFSRCGCVRAH